MAPTELAAVPRGIAAGVLACCWLAGGCGGPGGAGPAGTEAAADPVRVLWYHLDGYGLRDRDRDGIANEPKPPVACAAVAAVIAASRPDVLAVLDVGSAADLLQLAGDLADRDLAFPHRRWLPAPPPTGGAAILSRLPIVAAQSPTNLAYRIGDTTLTNRPPILDVTVLAGPARLLRILVAECKDKTFHPLGQTEMRRNEARLLSNHLRDTIARPAQDWVLAAVALHDEPDSAPLQRLLDPAFTPTRELPARDDRGRGWTTWVPEREAYLRANYVLASPALRTSGAEAVIVDHPLVLEASRHRPILVSVPRD